MHPWMMKPDMKRPIGMSNGNGQSSVARNSVHGTGSQVERQQASPVTAPIRRQNGTPAVSGRQNGTSAVSGRQNGTPAVSGRQNGTSTVSGGEIRRSNGHSSRISIVIADDHPITLAGLDSLLSREPDFMILARCSDPNEAIKAVVTYQPDILVLDQEMPVLDGIAVVKHLRRVRPETRVVLLATKSDQHLSEALQLGVPGVIYKNVDPRHLTRCVREVYAGRKWMDPTLGSQLTDRPAGGPVVDALTRRQFEVARAAVSGLSNKELAQQLGVSEGTIKNHLHAIYERLNIDGRLALLLYLKEKALA
jgi:DNA-binding NarL/FixJ family response regulator